MCRHRTILNLPNMVIPGYLTYLLFTVTWVYGYPRSKPSNISSKNHPLRPLSEATAKVCRMNLCRTEVMSTSDQLKIHQFLRLGDLPWPIIFELLGRTTWFILMCMDFEWICQVLDRSWQILDFHLFLQRKTSSSKSQGPNTRRLANRAAYSRTKDASNNHLNSSKYIICWTNWTNLKYLYNSS